MGLKPFHLAVPVRDLGEARAFYGGLLGCDEGRSSEAWVDFDFFGHQLVVHLSREAGRPAMANEVDGHQVPVRHFGVVLDWEEQGRLAERLRAASLPFLVEPHVRFPGQAGEQSTFFVLDPSGNALEFKAMRDPDGLFRK